MTTEVYNIVDAIYNHVILDVHTQEKYDEAHIDGAILIPDCEIATKAEGILKDKNQLILVYCRSGRISKLASLGYTSCSSKYLINHFNFAD